jgi:hypothetical protein
MLGRQLRLLLGVARSKRLTCQLTLSAEAGMIYERFLRVAV